MLFITLGVVCGIAFGLVWTPAVVAVSYFENRRALATGVVMCGSGMGTCVFAPLIFWLLENYGLRGTFLILVFPTSVYNYTNVRLTVLSTTQGALYLNCAAVGAFFRPFSRVQRNSLGTSANTDKLTDVDQSKSVTLGLLENAEPVMLPEGQHVTMSTEADCIDEESRLTHVKQDDPEQVCSECGYL